MHVLNKTRVDNTSKKSEKERKNIKISIRNITKKLGENLVLDNLNCDIYENEIFYVIGMSGAGKSVLFKNIIGLMKPDRGQIFIDGVDVVTSSRKQMYQIRKKIGVLFQFAALFDSMNIYENVSFYLRRYTKKSKDEIYEIVKEKLALVGLKGIESYMPSKLSIGIQKRVGLARALAMEPDIILFDEPTTSLDSIIGSVLDELIIELNKNLGVLCVVISHDIRSTLKVADRVGMLYKGSFLKLGTPKEIERDTSPILQQFFEGEARGPMTEHLYK